MRYGDSGQARTSDLDKLEKRVALLEGEVERLKIIEADYRALLTEPLGNLLRVAMDLR